MINGEFTEFLDQLYYGGELVFIYQDHKYFIQGWSEGDRSRMVLDKVNDAKFEGYIWTCEADSMRKCAEAFLAAPIWAGKDFMQIQDEVTWGDW